MGAGLDVEAYLDYGVGICVGVFCAPKLGVGVGVCVCSLHFAVL